MATQVVMPQLGESVVEGTVGRWLKQEGERIEEFEGLLEVESDKVDSEIPAPASGTVLKILVPEGQTVTAGTVLAIIGQAGEAVTDAPTQASAHGGHGSAPAPATTQEQTATSRSRESAPTSAQQGAATQQAAVSHGSNGGAAAPRVSPVVANIAAEHGIDVSRVHGTGMGGRVTKKDIMDYIEGGGKALPAPAPQRELDPWEQPGSGDLFKPTDDLYKKQPATSSQQSVTAQPAQRAAQAPSDHQHKAPAAIGRPGEIVPLSKMRRRIAEHMVESKLKIAPHVTTVFEADMSAVVKHRAANKAEFERRGVNLTFTAYFIAAIAEALRKHPMVNSSWTDEGVLLHRDCNVGMAVAIDEGLIVPVIKHADEKSLAGLAREVNDLAMRARNGQLMPDDIAGGTFTITNHGVSGSLFATPIINQPQTGILGVGAMKKRVVVLEEHDDAIAVRPMVYLTLTFDHRVLDGAGADFFVQTIKDRLEGWE